jgi:hypothetical protein
MHFERRRGRQCSEPRGTLAGTSASAESSVTRLSLPRVLQEMSDPIDANAVDAALEPEPHHVVNGAARLRVALSRERVAKVLNVIPQRPQAT